MRNRIIRRQEIYDLIWKEDQNQAAKTLGTDWHTLNTRCLDLLIPRPILHFDLLEEGVHLPQPPLPELPAWIDATGALNPNGKIFLKLFVQKRNPSFKAAYQKIAEPFWAAEEKRRQDHWAMLRQVSYEQERKRMEESNRINALRDASKAWEEASRMERFLQACELQLKPAPDSPSARWLLWANTQADNLNPLKNGYLQQSVDHFHRTS